MTGEQNQLGFFTTLSYDAAGRLTRVLDARANATTMSYDGRGSLLVNEDALGRRTSYAYDAVGNQILRSEGRGQLTTYAYDALDRIATVLYNNGKRVTHQYDVRGMESGWADSSGLYTLSYDALGRQLNVQDSTGAILTSSYDALSRRTLLQEASGVRTTYIYSASLVDIEVAGTGGVRLSDHLDTLGRFEWNQSLTLTPALVMARHYYDAAGRHYRTLNYRGTTPTTYLVDSPGTLDRVGNIIAINEINTTGARTTFTYDRANQLLSEWRDVLDAYRVTYTYDGMGNRLSAVESAGARTTSVYDGASQLITAQTGAAITTYSYDGNGNQTGQNALGALTTYTWDEENRLTNIAYPTGALSTYVYSADGLRRKREESGQSLLEVWDGTQLLQEKDSSTKAEVTRYLLQNSSYSGLRAQRQASDGVWRYFAYDVQGSTRKLLNSDGTSNLDLLYRAFGQKQAASGAGQTLMQFGAYYGYEWDADSRMWVKARHLSGTQGRWLSQDPIGFDGRDWNVWRYVENQTLTNFDASGLGSVIWGKTCRDNPDWLKQHVCLLKESPIQDRDFVPKADQWFTKPQYGDTPQTNIDAIYFSGAEGRKIYKVPNGRTVTIECEPFSIVSCCADSWLSRAVFFPCCDVSDVSLLDGRGTKVNTTGRRGGPTTRKSVWPINNWKGGECASPSVKLNFADLAPAGQRQGNRCGKASSKPSKPTTYPGGPPIDAYD